MSLKTEQSTWSSGPPPPSAYHYASSDSTAPNKGPHPTLPPMSSLLRHEPAEQRNQQQPYPFQGRRPLQEPPSSMSKHHPLALSQMDPTAPLQHIYHPPQSSLHSHPSQASSETAMLVPLHSQNAQSSPGGSNHGNLMPSNQRRQIKRIVQRRADPPKDHGHDTSTSTRTHEADPRFSHRYQHQQHQHQHQHAAFQQHPNNSDAYIRRGSENHPRSRHEDESLSFNMRRDSAHSDLSARRLSSQGPSLRSMPISGLLGDGSSPRMERPHANYKLIMRQEPIAARACGFGERDRRVIDPPPILQMLVHDSSSSADEISALIRQPFAVVHCTLWDPVNDRDDTAMPGTTDKRQQRRLMGTLVASPFVGKDEHGVEGCFFTFPDLSVRTPGTYQLMFKLVVLHPARMMQGFKEPIQSTGKSRDFHVYNAKDFKGMRPSTELTKTLKHQGCLISVKKGNSKSNGSSHERDDEVEDEEEDDEEVAAAADEEEGAERTSAVKRGKRPKR